MKSRDGKSQRREEKKKEDQRREREREKKEDAGARKGRKVAIHCVFPMICNSGGSKSRLAKASGAEPSGQMRDEQLHFVVARSTFGSQNFQNTPFSDHCRKSARHCGAKHVSKSNCAKHTSSGPLFEVEMSKKWTPLWREARFEVKSRKNWGVRSTFGRWDVVLRCSHKVFCTLPKVSSSSLNYQHHYAPLHSTTLHYITPQLQPQLQLQLQLHYTYTTLHYTTTTTITTTTTTTRFTAYILPSNYTYTTLHCTTLHPTWLHHTRLHSTTLHYTRTTTTLHYTTLYYTTVTLQ